MPTIPLSVYLTEKEYIKYIERKEDINEKVKHLVKKEINKESAKP